MSMLNEHTLLVQKSSWLWQTIYWAVASLLLFFIFSNQQYDLVIRVPVVLVLTLMSIGVTQLINRYLIPRFLFQRHFFRFFYLLLFTIVFSIWVNILCIILILFYTTVHFRGSALPNDTDLILLLSGSYITIFFATVVHFIVESYSKLIERDRIERQKTETELKLKEAKIKLLQGQLHPHFLFNMLNNLYGLWMEKSESTPDVILKLSALLDYMLYECDKERVPLEQEVQFLKNYIDLESIRHDSRLSLNVQLPDSYQNAEVAPLILFTFVENAFKHGVNRNTGDSRMNVCISYKINSIHFAINNNYSPSKNSSQGIGLENVKERLNLLYPGKHELKIDTQNNIFSVELNIIIS